MERLGAEKGLREALVHGEQKVAQRVDE